MPHAMDGIAAFRCLALGPGATLGSFLADVSLGCGFFIRARTTKFGDPAPGFPTLVTVMLSLGGVQSQPPARRVYWSNIHMDQDSSTRFFDAVLSREYGEAKGCTTSDGGRRIDH